MSEQVTQATNGELNLEEYLADGVRGIVTDAMRATLKDPRESAFLARYARASKEATKRREELAEAGDHIPAFLIASITSVCNLHCAGCYARQSLACNDDAAINQLTGDEWANVFEQARDLGVGFILLAGGEPLLRKDVIEAATAYPEILFPVFTNATLIDDAYLSLFDKNRNLVPVISLEGGLTTTDARRGSGTYARVNRAMSSLHDKHVPFGASVTLTTSNIDEVLSDEFLAELAGYGCKIVFYVEYVPVAGGDYALAPGDVERTRLSERIAGLRASQSDMMFLSFPGDELASGGCLAAGRGFFHINSHGGAEPCPFSPYSDVSVRDTSLLEAMRSPLFQALREGGLLEDDHDGGCVLFSQRDKVEELLAAE